jgi:hypothetical protein
MTARSLLITSVLALGVAADVRADPVTITSGFVSSIASFGSGPFQFEGSGFSASGSLEIGLVQPSLFCTPCTAGTEVPLDSSWEGTLGIAQNATVDGVSFGPITVGGGLFFNGPTITTPQTRGPFTVVAPFTFSGQMTGFDATQTTTLFTRELIGRGVLTASFLASGDPEIDGALFDFGEIRYDFNADAAPVPEPATLLLVGGGLGAALRYRKRRNANG